MAIHLHPATEKRFEETLHAREFPEESALLDYLLDVEANVQAHRAAFKEQVVRDVGLSRDQIAQGAYVTPEQLQERLAARRKAREGAGHEEQAA